MTIPSPAQAITAASQENEPSCWSGCYKSLLSMVLSIAHFFSNSTNTPLNIVIVEEVIETVVPTLTPEIAVINVILDKIETASDIISDEKFSPNE